MILLQWLKARILFPTSLLIFILVFPTGTSVVIGNQNIQVIILRTLKNPLKTNGPVSALVTSPNEDKSLYIVNGLTGEVQAYKNDSSPSYHTFAYTNGPLAVRSSAYIAYVDKNSKVAISNPEGRTIRKVNTPAAISLAILSNGNIVVASPTQNRFLHLYNSAGQLLRSFGTLKKHNQVDHAEIHFLHKGKLLVDAADNIYYVYHYMPLIQKFSPTGELEREIKVEGEAIDLQQELAQRFFSKRAPNIVGGITIINSAAIDSKTGHLWISLNGSSLTGTVYEYNTYGEKLREYALEVNSTFGISQIITGVSDIAILDTKLYALTSQNQVFEFERNEIPPRRTINRLERRIEEKDHLIKPVGYLRRLR